MSSIVINIIAVTLQMFGLDPYAGHAFLNTEDFVDNSLKTMHAPPEVRCQYQKNIALLVSSSNYSQQNIHTFSFVQRKFVREEDPPSDKFHRNFRQWLDNNSLDEEAVLEEDRAIDYSQNQETVECEIISGRGEEEPVTAGGPNGGHYLDPENPIYTDTDDLHVYNSQSSPLLTASGNSTMNETEYQDWAAQHGETVASMLENC